MMNRSIDDRMCVATLDDVDVEKMELLFSVHGCGTLWRAAIILAFDARDPSSI